MLRNKRETKKKKKIIIAVEIVLLIIFIIFLIYECKKICDCIISNYILYKHVKPQFSLVFPFINKDMQNDTFFTIAIGRNIIKNGFTNVDNLTFHGKLSFPHSGIFDIIINFIYEIGGFRRNLYLCVYNCYFYSYQFSIYIL